VFIYGIEQLHVLRTDTLGEGDEFGPRVERVFAGHHELGVRAFQLGWSNLLDGSLRLAGDWIESPALTGGNGSCSFADRLQLLPQEPIRQR
jgi:hypothetical protein